MAAAARGIANNNIRGMVSEWGGVRMTRNTTNSKTRRCVPIPLVKIRQHMRKITFYDVFAFTAIFLTALFNSLSPRSLISNLVIGLVMLLKVFIGVAFYNKNTLSSIRTYLFARYIYNIVVICPTYVLLRYFTSAYIANYFYTGGILCAIELLIATFYAPNLFQRQAVETIEDIPGFKIIHSANQEADMRFSSSSKHRGKPKIVVNMNVREAARYIENEIGEEAARDIVERMQERY